MFSPFQVELGERRERQQEISLTGNEGGDGSVSHYQEWNTVTIYMGQTQSIFLNRFLETT